jgi:hypothetical protein
MARSRTNFANWQKKQIVKKNKIMHGGRIKCEGNVPGYTCPISDTTLSQSTMTYEHLIPEHITMQSEVGNACILCKMCSSVKTRKELKYFPRKNMVRSVDVRSRQIWIGTMFNKSKYKSGPKMWRERFQYYCDNVVGKLY